MTKKVDVVIVSYSVNHACVETTRKCIESLLLSEFDAENIFNIIVVESNPEKKWEYLSSSVKTYESPLPYGYNKFLNFGRKQGNSDWVVLCNNDLIFEKNWFANILNVSIANPDVLSFSPICPLTQKLYGIDVNSGNYLGYQIRRQISGWCIIHKRLIYEKIGDLDESFIHWFCDNDYAATLFFSNIKHVLVTSSIVYHHSETIGNTTKSVVNSQEELNEITVHAQNLFNHKYKNNFKQWDFYDMKRYDFINKIIDFKKYKKYLEIGVLNGECFEKIICKSKIGVDQNLNCKHATHKMTSNIFFSCIQPNEKFDIIFIDGSHLENQVDKDIENSIKYLEDGGTIVVHNSNPPTEFHAMEKPFLEAPAHGDWNGTVYKSLIKIRLNRDDIYLETVDADWGLTILTKNKSEKLNHLELNEITWQYFDSNRKDILNFISVEKFCEKYEFFKIGLCMIVKNEEHIITRCLNSVKPLIDYVVIVDTGSTDNTIDKINEWLFENKIKGIVLQEPWRDFSYNRSHALAEIRKIEKIEYVLMIDADEILKFDENFDFKSIKQYLTKDIHSIECRHGSISYLRNSITKNNKSFCYKGVVHEFLHCNEIFVFGEVIRGIYNIPLQDSSRNKISDKYRKDAEVLEEAIKNEKDVSLLSRYCFYLAQSYRDCGEKEKAMHWYNERVKCAGWNEEVYYSLLQISKIKEFLALSEDDIIQSYMKAHEVCPERIEAIFGAVMFCRKNSRYQQAYILAKHAKNIKVKQDGLFVENWIYDYGIDDELGVVCYWTGNYKEAIEISEALINKIPIDQKPRIFKNLELLWKKSI